jgi:hypothetical protein
MTRAKFRRFCNDFVKELRKIAPYDTGNLSKNAIRFVFEGETAKIYVDMNIAPYMPYTNEPWVSPKWNGKKNPNEAWWNNAIPTILNKLLPKYNGDLK